MLVKNTVMNSSRVAPVVGSPDRAVQVMVVAGEASSDQHGSELVKDLLTKLPRAMVWGMGGSSLRRVGMEIVVDSETHGSVMGITEVVGSLRAILSARSKLIEAAKERRPDLLILVDYPDFNLNLAKVVRPYVGKILYFISPQLWAWRRGRIASMHKLIDAVACIIPFEQNFYRNHTIRAQYVGHPFIDRPPLTQSREQFLIGLGLQSARPVLALLPGSRRAEVSRLLPVMLEALLLIKRELPEVQALLPLAPSLSREWVEKVVNGVIRTTGRFAVGEVSSRDVVSDIVLVDGQAQAVLSAADFSFVTSGTATVEAALAGNPFLVAYKLSPVSYLLARLLVRGVKFFAMPNLIADRAVVPELLQGQVTPQALSSLCLRYLRDPQLVERTRVDLRQVKQELVGEFSDNSSSAGRAADLAIELLNGLKLECC